MVLSEDRQATRNDKYVFSFYTCFSPEPLSMIVSVIPLKRLPRQLSWLDYGVPEEYKDTVAIGQLITIPLRKTVVFGIIYRIQKEIPKELEGKEIKPFEKIITTAPLFSIGQLAMIEKIASWYAVSISVIASMMAPPLQKRKLGNIEINREEVLKEIQQEKKESFYYYTNNTERNNFFSEKIQGNTLLLVPTVHDIAEAYALLTPAQQRDCLIWHSNLSQKEQFAIWFAVRNNEKNIVLGTRGSVFLPFQKLSTVIVDFEHHDQHKHWDQAPRYHAKDIAREIARVHDAHLYLSSFTPSQEVYFNSHKHIIDSTLPESQTPLTPPPTLIDLKIEHTGKNFSPISFQAEACLRGDTGDTFFYLNRRGYASSISCSSCAKVVTCETCHLPMTYYMERGKLKCHPCNYDIAMPRACADCKGTLTQLKGVGIEQLETFIPHLEDVTREIVRIDSDTGVPHFDDDKSYIIVGTDAAIPHLRWDNISSIVLINIDQQLHIPEYTANEDVWHFIETIQYRRKPESTFLIQTSNPEHVVFRGFKQPDLFYRLDLNLRRALLFPPYSHMTRFFFGHTNAEYARKIAEQTYNHLTQALTNTPKKIKILPPIEMQPKYFRKKYWYAIMVKSDPALWQENLVWMNQYIPGDWKIDPNPISLLAP